MHVCKCVCVCVCVCVPVCVVMQVDTGRRMLPILLKREKLQAEVCG